jgi:hypothetical protein
MAPRQGASSLQSPLTVGGDVIDPWQYIGTGMLQSYLNLWHLHRDEQMQVVPLWATEWRQANEGVYFTFNPKAER